MKMLSENKTTVIIYNYIFPHQLNYYFKLYIALL